MKAIDHLTKLICHRNEAAERGILDRRQWLNEQQTRDMAFQDALSVHGDRLRRWIDRDALSLSADEIQELENYFREEWK